MIEDLKIRNYSPRTIDAYVRCVGQYSRHFGRSPDQLGRDHIRSYQLYLVEQKKASWPLFNQSVCALRFFYQVTLGRDSIIDHIPYPRGERKLPDVLSPKELSTFFQAVQNLKHRTVFMTMYGSGLRISEALGLFLQDVDSERMQLRIRQGKGNKDRYGLLSQSTLEVLRRYWQQYQPSLYLFPGKKPDRPLAARSMQRVCRAARIKAGMKKQVTTHSMRHCFATHLLETGVDLKTIQMLMGHRCIKTTAFYLHLSPIAFKSRQGALDLLNALSQA
jgi:site-specific recombinase XerD